MFSEKTLTKNDIELLKNKYPNDYETYIEKVKNGYPVQYLIGNVDFFNTSILVNENVLIPRFETEYLVEKIISKLESQKNNPLKVLDIGTGSGCISIAIAKNTNWLCTGIDISKKALNVAIINNERNKTNVDFKELDILTQNIEDNYDVYVSNPPYIAYDEIVDKSVKYEPSIALYAEHDGLLFYETILKKITNNPKLIAFEIGENEGKKIMEIAKEAFPNAKINIEKDLCGKERYLFIQNE